MQDSLGLVGSTITGKYRIEAVAGEGGFGVVYRGHHLNFDRPVAVKCLKVPTHFTGDARRLFIERFAEEGKLLFRLSEHRSVVRVFDYSVIDIAGQPVPYLILEWLDGVSLDDYLVQRRTQGLPPLTEIEALRMLRDAIEGLAFAHQLRVAHRDVKPANLFLVRTNSGTVTKLLDFGVAKLMEEADVMTRYATQTSSGFRAFSPQYGAPEQFFSKTFGQSGPWTDVHAMGLLMTELVSSRPAFDGTEFGEFYAQALGDARPTPAARGAAVSPAFDALCARALAREPRNRYRSGADLLTAVDAHLTAAQASGWSPPSARPRTSRRAPLIAASLIGLLAIIVITGTVVVSRSSGPPAAPGDLNDPRPIASTVIPTADALPSTPPPIDAPIHQPTADDGHNGRAQDHSVVALDGVVFRVGEQVFVRRSKATFVRGRVESMTHEKAIVDGAEVSMDDISPAEMAALSWSVGTVVLLGSNTNATTFLGEVTAVHENGLTLNFWDGRSRRAVWFSASDANTGDLGRPVRVRESWQTPLAQVLKTFRPVVRPAAAPQLPAISETPSCSDYCVRVAAHEKGSPGYEACLAGCK